MARLDDAKNPGAFRVAVFRALKLGDMLCAVPALRALRASLPHAHVTLVGLSNAAWMRSRFPAYVDAFEECVAEGLPEDLATTSISEVTLGPIRAKKFSLAIQMHGDGSLSNRWALLFGARRTVGFRPAAESPWSTEGMSRTVPYPEQGHEIHRLLTLVSGLGGIVCGDDLEFDVRDEDERRLAVRLTLAGLKPGRRYVCLHPGTADASRCWDPDGFAAVGRALAARGYKMVLTGMPKEAPVVARIARQIGPKAIDTTALALDVGALAALYRSASLLVCNDTGVSHLAAALGLPSVVIFTRDVRERWAPLNRKIHHSLYRPGGLSPDEVLRHALDLIDGRARRSMREGGVSCDGFAS